MKWMACTSLAILGLLVSCTGKNPGGIGVEEQMLSIEGQTSVSELREKGLSKAEELRLKQLRKELKSLSKAVQEPLLEYSRYANRNQALALIFLNHGMYQSARQYLSKAIEYEGNNATLFYYRGLCSAWLMKSSIDADERSGYLEQAEWDYRRSLEIKADYVESLYGLAVLELFENQDYGAAASLLDRYIAKRNIAKKAAQSRGKVKTLREAQRRAKELGNLVRTKDVNVLFMRAQAAYGLRRINEAASFYDWAATVAVDAGVRSRAEALKNQVLQENKYRADSP